MTCRFDEPRLGEEAPKAAPGVRVLGIDPGLRGAMALYDGTTVEITDIPVLPVRKSGRVRHEIDGYELARAIDALGHVDHAAVELVGAMPTDGVVGAFSFGRALGEIVGILRAHFIPLTFPPPRVWRKAMGVPPAVKGDKHPSISVATALFPRCSGMWAAVRGNGDANIRGGRAEAALIAGYCWQQVRDVSNLAERR